MQALTISGEEHGVLLGVAPPRDARFPLTWMRVQDFPGFAERGMRVIAKARTRAGFRLRLVSAGSGRLWDYRVYREAAAGWELHRLEALSRFSDERSRAGGWRAVFSSFAGEAGLGRLDANLLRALAAYG